MVKYEKYALFLYKCCFFLKKRRKKQWPVFQLKTGAVLEKKVTSVIK